MKKKSSFYDKSALSYIYFTVLTKKWFIILYRACEKVVDSA